MRIHCFIIAVFMLFSTVALADDAFEKGQKAYKSKNYAAALSIWGPLAEQRGNARAQYNIGVMYENGQAVDKDETAAVRWYRRAAEQGYVTAQSDLGRMFEQGTGVRQDFLEAAKWFRLAASQNNAYSQHNLGLLYRDGKGVPENPVVAYAWFNLAAAARHPNAAKERDEVVKQLSQKELTQAQQLSASWKPGTLIKEVKWVAKTKARSQTDSQPSSHAGPVSLDGEPRDDMGRKIIRGPVSGGYYDNVHIISDSVGVQGNSVTISNSVIEAPVCIRTGGLQSSITNNNLVCGLCIEFTGSVFLGTRLIDNRCSGRGTNRPDIFGW